MKIARLYRDIVLYSAGKNGALLLVTVANLAVRSFLEPQIFGAVFLASTYALYMSSLNTPIANLWDIKLPLVRVQGRAGDAERFISEAYTIFHWSISAQVLGLAFLGYWVATDNFTLVTFLLVALGHAFAQSQRLDILLLKSHRYFKEICVGILAVSVVGSLGILLFSWVFEGYGYVVAYVSQLVVGGLYFRWQAARLLRPEWKVWGDCRAAAKVMLTAGMAILVYKLGVEAMMTVDRLFVEAHLGLETLGIYSIAVAIVNVARTVPQSVAGAALPTYLRMHNGKRSEADLEDRTAKFHYAVLLVSLAVFSVGLTVVPWLLTDIFPRYEAAVVPALLLLVGEVVQQARAAPAAFFFGKERQARLTGVAIVGTCAALGGGYLLVIRMDGGMAAAALGTVTAYLVAYIYLVGKSPPSVRMRYLLATFGALTVGCGGLLVNLTVEGSATIAINLGIGVGSTYLLSRLIRVERMDAGASGASFPGATGIK